MNMGASMYLVSPLSKRWMGMHSLSPRLLDMSEQNILSSEAQRLYRRGVIVASLYFVCVVMFATAVAKAAPSNSLVQTLISVFGIILVIPGLALAILAICE